jgi:antitoxin MazE
MKTQFVKGKRAVVVKVIDRPRKRRRYRLEQLIDAISEENRHPETDWGPPVGNEVW